ncbi:hypothetical protein [Posidoniimonas polymericola]|uniref:hypothetical protein n=1 Tax=Posidoniimonas polymericola TaxID=2528002 RepID=UPI0011B43258|nr:hypothetical protein [Posidoniimonas polymericola]
MEEFGGNQESLFNAVLHQGWSAVFCDIASPLESKVEQMRLRSDDVILRFFKEHEGPESLPSNRLPVYWLRGMHGKVGPDSAQDATGLMTRMSMIKRAPAGQEVFVLGVAGDEGLAGILQAAQLTDAFRELVLVGRPRYDPTAIESVSRRLFIWDTDPAGFATVVEEATRPDEGQRQATILIKSGDGKAEVNLLPCIDPSHPITNAFELIPADEILAERQPTAQDFQEFLADPTQSWLPYASGIPYPRHPEYERNLSKYLRRFEKEGPSLSCTAWLPADDGSGATTTLRQLAFNLARDGYPALIARTTSTSIDFKQLAAFLSQAASRVTDVGLTPSDIPWIIAFDAQHTQLCWESICGLSSGLKNLMRSVVILAVLPEGSLRSEATRKAQGANRKIGDTLENSVTVDQGLMIGAHLSQFLPASSRRSEADWRWFTRDSARPEASGPHSLFWVALRFWLAHIPTTEQSLRKWLAGKLRELVAGDAHRYRALLEIAVLGKHRLPMPISLLQADGAISLSTDIQLANSSLGLRRSAQRGGQVLSYAHPLIAEELLRIAEADVDALAAIEMEACTSLLDMELHLLSGLVARTAAGTEECLPLMEDLVTSALRVDPRESPRNYQARDRVVEILQGATPAIWDASQVFNHHVAKARRHLAVDPPDSRWTDEMRREQLSLAEQHLDDALYEIKPAHSSRPESRLNLYVSMALTLGARSRLERNCGEEETAQRFSAQSEEYYSKAQALDPENTYVLENFARHKLAAAQQIGDSEARIRLIVEAISMLELEQDADEAGNRKYETTEELAKAFAMLEGDDSSNELSRLASEGSEPALVALAKLRLQPLMGDIGEDEEQTLLAEAEELLTRIVPEERTWRSSASLYRVVCRRSPRDFHRRLELLEELDSDPRFVWPQQFRLEFAILLFQAGDNRARQRGSDIYKELRADMASRSAAPRVPGELKYLRDPSADFSKPLKTFIIVKNVSDVGRTSYGIPNGWGNVDVAFRAYQFGRDRISPNEELDCYIQFTNFGPQAVPLTEGGRRNE